MEIPLVEVIFMKSTVLMIAAIGIYLVGGYGITECSPLVSVNDPHTITYDTVGRPPGPFDRTVLLILSGERPTVRLRYRGTATAAPSLNILSPF